MFVFENKGSEGLCNAGQEKATYGNCFVVVVVVFIFSIYWAPKIHTADRVGKRERVLLR